MRWFIFLLFGLILTGIAAFEALAVTGTLTYSIGPPAGVTCDYGPNTTFPTGAVGADLTTAGFTHCVLNADFTDNSGAQVNGGLGCSPGNSCAWVMNNPNTYVTACGGVSWNVWGWFSVTFDGVPNGWNSGNGGYNAIVAPCNRSAIVNDSTSGKNAFQIQFFPSDEQPPGTGTTVGGMQIHWPLCGPGSHNAASGPGADGPCSNNRPALPELIYEEWTYRVAGGTTNTANNNLFLNRDELSNFDGGTSPNSNGFLDFVWAESYPNGGVTYMSLDNSAYTVGGVPCVGNSNGVCASSGGQTHPDFPNYHTYGSLVTSPGNANTAAVCMYLDGSPMLWDSGTATNWGSANCGYINQFNDTELIPHDKRIDINIGGAPTSTITLLIQKIRIFTCGNWKGDGNHCTGPQVLH